MLGGFFNPPHIGHLVCAQEALWQLELDTVTLMPFGQPPHREASSDPGPEHRFTLCRAAAAGNESLTVSRAEIDRAGPSYTADTLRALHKVAPGDELHFIMGADEAIALPGWHEPEEVLRLARVAVAGRDDRGEEEVRAALARLGGPDRLIFFSMPGIDISSTMVRDRVAKGEPIRYLVPEEVARYIADHGLYRGGSSA